MQKLQVVIPTFFVIASIFTSDLNRSMVKNDKGVEKYSTKDPKWSEENIT
jgi:hypothetical protein